MTLFVLFSIFSVLLLLGMPVAFAMGVSATVALLTISDIPLTLIPQRLFTAVNSFPLMAVPFFILAGLIMNVGGITRRIVRLSSALVGHLPGGLAQVNVVASMLFAGISGSASADASAIGSMLIPAMVEDGYDAPFSVAVTAASATIGPIIPPSLVMVIYGSMTDMSIGALFAGGLIPGILIGLAQMAVVYYYARKRGYSKGTRAPLRVILKRFREAAWALFAPIIILGGILSGVFTATEAGVVAAVYAFFVGCFVYREIRLSQIREILVRATVMTSVPMVILASASVFGWILAREQFSSALAQMLLRVSGNPQVTFLLIVAILLLVGLFIEALAAMMIFVPVFTPIAAHLGWDPIHFALVLIVTLLIGTVTPPVGLQLYIAAAIGKVPISKMGIIWPFVAAMVLVVVVMVFVPGTVTWVPHLFFR